MGATGRRWGLPGDGGASTAPSDELSDCNIDAVRWVFR